MSVLPAAVLALDETLASPGLLGFVVFALLALATFLLVRSMNKRLRRIDVDAHARETGSGDPPAGD